MAYHTIMFEKRDAVGLLTLNRPQRRNAINRAMLDELKAALDDAEVDPEIRAIVVTGAGGAFSSGFDLKEQAERPPQGVDEWRPVLRHDFDGVMRFWHFAKPTIAAVRGPALAGGCELVLACDLAVAADDAIFGEPELKFGAGIVVMLLPWVTGPKQAKELLLTGDDRIDAGRALALGLVNRVVPAGQEIETALGLARRMAAMDPGLVRRTKLAINQSYAIMGMDKALAMALDADLLIEGTGTEDKRRFLEIVRQQGLGAAIAWREARFAPDRSGKP